MSGIMIEQLFSGGTYQAVKHMLDLSAQRHEVLAGNIANVETPGYRRLEIDRSSTASFQSQLAAAAHSGDFKRVSTTAAAAHPTAAVTVDPTARSVRQDGNNVEVDQELLAMSQNTTEYGAMTEFASSSLKCLKIAITGQPS